MGNVILPSAPKKLTIKRADETHIAAISKMAVLLNNEFNSLLNIESPPSDISEISEQLQNLMQEKDYIFLIAIDSQRNDLPIGFLSMCPCQSIFKPSVFGVLQEIFIDYPFRQFGVGKTLLKYAKQQARTKKWSAIDIAMPVIPALNSAVKFFEYNNYKMSSNGHLITRVLG